MAAWLQNKRIADWPLPFKDPYGAHRRAGVPLVGGSWQNAEIADDDIAGVVFQDCVFERVRMTGSSLWQTMFVNCRFDDCEFTGCRLFRTQWINCSGAGFRVAGGEFAEAVFSECRFDELALGRSGDRIVFGSCELARVAFLGDGCMQRGLTVSDCLFRTVTAEHARWDSATAVAVDFGVWSLRDAVFERCMFVHSRAPGFDFSNVRFSACNLYKSDFRKAIFGAAPGSIFAESDCTESDFTEADLTGALFSKTVAAGARFTGAKLVNAMFPESTLTGADFSGVTARESVWNGADLTDANFEGVDAYRSTFRNSVFKGTRLDGARLVEADLHGVDASLAGADLRGARGTDWRAEREKEIREFRRSAP